MLHAVIFSFPINIMAAVTTSVGLAVAATIAVIAGSAAAVAETSLPGDLLYSVKTEINEGFKTGIAFTAESNAEAEAEIAVQRLDEAARLSEEGRLNASVRSMLQNEFDAHAENAVSFAEDAAANGNFDGAARVMSDFSATLEVRRQTLVDLAESESDQAAQISIMAALARSVQSVADTKSREFEAQTTAGSQTEASAGFEATVRTNAQNTLDAAQNVVDETRIMFDSAVGAGANLSAEAGTELNAAIENMNRARIEFQQEAYARAQEFSFYATEAAQNVRGQIESVVDGTVESNTNTSAEVDASIDGESREATGSVETSGSLDPDY